MPSHSSQGFYQYPQQDRSHLSTHGLINLPKDQKQASRKQTSGKLFNMSRLLSNMEHCDVVAARRPGGPASVLTSPGGPGPCGGSPSGTCMLLCRNPPGTWTSPTAGTSPATVDRKQTVKDGRSVPGSPLTSREPSDRWLIPRLFMLISPSKHPNKHPCSECRRCS